MQEKRGGGKTHNAASQPNSVELQVESNPSRAGNSKRERKKSRKGGERRERSVVGNLFNHEHRCAQNAELAGQGRSSELA
jgi:hypothetical protein